jgi:hypothetical protein
LAAATAIRSISIRFETILAQYTEKYGADNAQYLMDMEQGWIREYKRAVFIDWGLPGSENAKAYTKECANYLGWEYDEIAGSDELIQQLIDGNWDDEDFLVVSPGQTIRDDLTKAHIMKTEPHCDHCTPEPDTPHESNG